MAEEAPLAPIAVLGAGTMGTGIVQIAALAGHRVYVYDAIARAVNRCVATVRDRVLKLGDSAETKAEDLQVVAVQSLDQLRDAEFVIEAVQEDLAIKQELLKAVERVVSPTCVLATNTSSLSPTACASALERPERFVGVHFFNPVPLMHLVEIVQGKATAPEVAEKARTLVQSWGKTAIALKDSPGFIVNRIARSYYGEALRLLEDRAADVPTIDAVLTGAGGFRMGPFALMDLIGNDVNYAATTSVWKSFANDRRFAPSFEQRCLVDAGWFGRKTGRGFYHYRDGQVYPVPTPYPSMPAPASVACDPRAELWGLISRADGVVNETPCESNTVDLPGGAVLVRAGCSTASEIETTISRPVIVVDRTLNDLTATAIAVASSHNCSPLALHEAVGLLQAAGLAVFVIDDVPGLIVARTVAMLINLAIDVLSNGVANADDIDRAMKLGANYPVGPLEWGASLGLNQVLEILVSLQAYYGDDRYRPSSLLRRAVLSGTVPW